MDVFVRRTGILSAVIGAAIAWNGAIVSQAAVVSFISSNPFTDATGLLTPTGVNDYAIDMGSNAYTSAGVSFEAGPAASATGSNPTSTNASGNVTLFNTVTGGTNNVRASTSFLSTTTVPTLATVQASVDTNFGLVMRSANYAGGSAAPFQITLHHLSPGQTYELQLYFVDGRSGPSGSTVALSNTLTDFGTTLATTTAPFQAVYAFGATPANPTIGIYVLATFTADAVDQSFYTNTYSSASAATNPTGNTGGQINAIVLQAISGSTVPEPASLGVLVLGASALIARRRR